MQIDYLTILEFVFEIIVFLVLMLIFRFIFNNKVEVPNVVGKKIDDVSLILLERNLKYKVKNVVSEDGKKIGDRKQLISHFLKYFTKKLVHL